MKKIIILSALLIAVSTSVFAAKPATSVKVVSKGNDVVYLKVSDDMIGAEIDVQDSTGQVIFTTIVTEHKLIVDFYAEPSGDYTIVVKKDCNTKEISYSKFTKSQSALADHNYVVVEQM